MTLLAIETSSRLASAALVDEAGCVLAAVTWEAGRGSSSTPLFDFIEAAGDHEVRPARIVAGIGPGSYSGTRIGIAAALGAGMAWGIPVLGLTSALGFDDHGRGLRVIGDARRETAYHALVADGLCLREPELLDREQLAGTVESGPPLETVSSDPPPWWTLPVTREFPSASTLARAALLAGARLVDGSQGLEPLYLRPPTITRPNN